MLTMGVGLERDLNPDFHALLLSIPDIHTSLVDQIGYLTTLQPTHASLRYLLNKRISHVILFSQIYDPNNKRFEVPIATPRVSNAASSTDYDVSISKDFFGLTVKRSSNKATPL